MPVQRGTPHWHHQHSSSTTSSGSSSITDVRHDHVQHTTAQTDVAGEEVWLQHLVAVSIVEHEAQVVEDALREPLRRVAR